MAESSTNWVQCERCQKWRRITNEYADTVDDEVEWYCELNPDKQFANCNIPQELTDEQIDQEAAELAELSAQAGGSAPVTPAPEPEPEPEEQPAQSLPKLPAVVQLISENYFSHRKRKEQDEDDIMVCHCPPPWRGGDGCGPNCINRMLCIECTEDFCPCENQCNNQMFSRKQYAKVAVRRAGPKGHGLYTDEDLAAGQFVIQYVGEVLEEEEYLRRKHYYIQTGQRHYYFMNIGNGEVIDACRKGNVARFINHSCEPNCETQKWMVRGELAIGLFTLRKIKAGEELTFDYNFERYGDKPMRCFCGSKKCRKFIGGTQETTANIVELGDAEDVTNEPAPVLVEEKETDVLVQAMLDKEVGTTQRGWDAKMLGRLQQLCRQKGVDWSYAPDEAGLTASTQQAAANSSFAEYQSEESSHAAGALPAATAASPASSSAPATGTFGKFGLDGAESRPAAKKAPKRKRKAEQDPAAAAAAALKKQQQEERKRQRLQKQQERQQKQQREFLKRQELELARLQRLKQQQGAPADGQQGKKRQWQQAAGSDGEGLAEGAAAASDKQQRDSELEDDMSSDDSQQPGGSQAAEEDEESAEESESDEDEQEEAPKQLQQPAKRPLSSRVRVVQGRRKPPLAPKPKEAAPPAKRSFLTLAVPAPSRPLKKRSEVDRRLEQLVLKQSWKLKEPSKQSVIKVLRMFNLCDITPRQQDNQQQQPLQQQQQQARPEVSQGEGAAAGSSQQQGQQNDAAGGEVQQQMGGAAVVDEAGLPALPAHLQPLQQLKGAELEARERESEARFKARQRARMTDMGMILDVVLASNGEKLKKEWVNCGILTQLQQALGRLPFTQEYSVVLVKVVGVLEHLPITSDDLYTMRSAHGTFADLIRRMASSATDWEVRRRSHQLLKRYSAASCKDDTLLQLYNLPGPNGKPYLLSLHLPPQQLQRLTALLPNNPSDNSAARRRVPKRGRTPPPRGPGPAGHGPPGPWVPPHGPPPGYGPPSVGEPHSSPSTSHGGPGAVPAAAAAARAQEGGSSMAAADSSGGWPPQQPWDGSGLPPPPWAAGGGGSALPPPGFRGPGRPPGRQLGWQAGGGGPPFGGPRPGSSGAVAGPSPGDWPDRSDAAGGPPGAEGPAAAGGQLGSSRGDRSPEGGYGREGPWGLPDWQGRPPRGEWDAGGGGGPGGRFPGRFGPPGGPMAFSYRERERERRGWGRWEPDSWAEGDFGRGREREWGAREDEGPAGSSFGDRHDPEAAAAKRQRREPFDGPGGQWGPYGPSPDMQRGGGPFIGDLSDDPLPGERGWRQDSAAAAGGRGSRQGGWRERQPGWPAADPGVPPGHGAAVEDLFVMGVVDSVVLDADWRAWSAAVGPAGADGPLSPLISPVGGGGVPGGRPGGSRPHTPHMPPPGEGRLGMEEAFSGAPDAWGSDGGWGARPPSRGGHHATPGQQQQQQQWLGGPSSSRQGQGTPSEQQAARQQSLQQYPDSWEQPGPDFETFVSEAVKHRLGKYVQPDHPNRISKEEAQQLYKKLRRQVVEKEAAACAERQAAGSHKPIERSKLEANIKEFVRLSIRRLHTARPGGGAAGGQHPGSVNGV